MPEPPAASPEQSDTLDALAQDLQDLRYSAGPVSYAEIVLRIAARRRSEGVPENACRPARTTVYDTFRTGRSRINVQLVGEIVLALEGSEEDAEQWRRRCRRAMRPGGGRSASASTDVVVDTAAATGPVPEAAEEPAEAPAQEPLRPRDPAGVAPHEDPASAGRRRPSWTAVLAVLLVALVVDTAGRYLSGWLELPLYLDMVGTALAAMALGPWWGVLVALASQGLAAWWTDGLAALWIAPVNVVGALVWGYGLRSWRAGRSLPSFLGLTAVAAVTCSLVAVPVLLLVPGMQQRQAPGETADDIQAVWHSVVVAVLSSNMLYSLADKLLAGILVLPALQSLRRHWWIPVFTTTFDESVAAVRDAAFVARLRAGRWFSRRTVR